MTTSSGALAIEAEGLRRVFANRVEAVAGLDLGVREGEIFGFLGPNGAGKTTTVRMLVTLLRPTAGRARVAGHDVVRHPHRVRRAIGVALQDSGLDALATGRELLTLQGRLHGLSGGAPDRRATELLEMVGLADAADRRVGAYSGGMRRRLDLASALVHRPRVLFLDEPTAGLDPASRRAVWDEIRRLNRTGGVTVLLTTQYLEEADQIAGRIAIMDRGRIVAEGSPEALKASIGADVVAVSLPLESVPGARAALASVPGLTDVEADGAGITLFVKDGAGAVAEVVRLLDRAAIPVGSVSVSRPTLDEVFLRATGSRLEGAESTT